MARKLENRSGLADQARSPKVPTVLGKAVAHDAERNPLLGRKATYESSQRPFSRPRSSKMSQDVSSSEKSQKLAQLVTQAPPGEVK